VHRSDWDTLVSMVDAGERAKEMGSMVPPPPGSGHEANKLFEPVGCPACRAPAERLTFAARSKTVIDVCVEHGIWFDAAELVAVLDFLRTRHERGDAPEEPDKDAMLAQYRAATERALSSAERIIADRRAEQQRAIDQLLNELG